MSDPVTASGPSGRPRTVRRVLAAVAVVIMLAGTALLLLPYSKTVDVSLGGSGLFDAPGSVQARCQPPLVDAFTGESDDWLNYAPGDGGRVEGTVSGTWCTPQSLQRGVIGASLIIFGLCSLLALEVVRQRQRRQVAAAVATDDPGAEPGAGDDAVGAPDPSAS